MDPICALAALTFLIGNAISAAYLKKERDHDHFNYETFRQLNPDSIERGWAFRRENQNLELAGSFINAFSWIFFAIPIIQCSIILSRGGTRKLSIHVAMAVIVIAGCASEFLARLMYLGTSNWGVWLSSEYNLNQWETDGTEDNIGWRVLETAHLITRGTILWIDSFEYLTLFATLILFYISVNSMPSDGPTISRALASFGLFIGLFSLSDFIGGVLRLRDWRTFSLLTMLISIINRVICLPLFLLLLGCQLPNAKTEHKQQEVTRTAMSVNRSRHWVDSTSSPPRVDAVEMVASNGD